MVKRVFVHSLILMLPVFTSVHGPQALAHFHSSPPAELLFCTRARELSHKEAHGSPQVIAKPMTASLPPEPLPQSLSPSCGPHAPLSLLLSLVLPNHSPDARMGVEVFFAPGGELTHKGDRKGNTRPNSLHSIIQGFLFLPFCGHCGFLRSAPR